jgi:hypothetical protein
MQCHRVARIRAIIVVVCVDTYSCCREDGAIYSACITKFVCPSPQFLAANKLICMRVERHLQAQVVSGACGLPELHQVSPPPLDCTITINTL